MLCGFSKQDPSFKFLQNKGYEFFMKANAHLLFLQFVISS